MIDNLLIVVCIVAILLALVAILISVSIKTNNKNTTLLEGILKYLEEIVSQNSHTAKDLKKINESLDVIEDQNKKN